ncbi:hypothetical protein [Marinobacter qingdaonensis]|uniref:Uncharacterized protein n=1 Tax=Marinobacter qingdaonensis TaxID=3108486 RepID=A0ABU5P0B9_9GAMM|nr:hypothetical protein [Marinobacter sp. ASW11-75]MEA1081494.1 hypothetical protein [Marinobacter sp. ASW11-75]
MALKEIVRGQLEKWSRELEPRWRETWTEVQYRLDELNCSLANRTVPDERRARVSELSLRQKAEEAGQGKARLKVVKGRNRASAAK